MASFICLAVGWGFCMGHLGSPPHGLSPWLAQTFSKGRLGPNSGGISFMSLEDCLKVIHISPTTIYGSKPSTRLVQIHDRKATDSWWVKHHHYTAKRSDGRVGGIHTQPVFIRVLFSTFKAYNPNEINLAAPDKMENNNGLNKTEVFFFFSHLNETRS